MHTFLDHIFHIWRSPAGLTAVRRLPRLDTLGLSTHDLADLNLPLGVRGRLESNRVTDIRRLGLL